MREALPQRRLSVTFTVEFWNQYWNVSVGFSRKYKPLEVFINATKTPGTDLDTTCRDCAIILSLALQYGCPLDEIAHAITRNERGHALGIVGEVLDKMLDFHA
jgi:hypothetical protein